MGESIVITAGKGGTGKTTAASAIASCLAALGSETLCIDMDISLRNLDLVLGMSSELSAMDLGDVAAGRCSLEDAAVPHPKIPGLYLLTAPGGSSPEDIRADGVSSIIEAAADRYDYCVIDSPAGLDTGFYLASAHADRAIVVSTPDSASLRDSQKAVMELDALGLRDIHLIVNRLRPRILQRSMSNVDDIIDFVGVPLIGIVPEDEDVIMAAGLSEPLILYSRKRAAKAFLRIARRVRGEKLPLKYR